jgi:hypothetical protein
MRAVPRQIDGQPRRGEIAIGESVAGEGNVDDEAAGLSAGRDRGNDSRGPCYAVSTYSS